MQIQKIRLIFFSATGRTEKAAELFLEPLPIRAEKINLTDCSSAQPALRFSTPELVVFAAPVYGGRIPAAAARRFAQLKGEKTPAILLAVFGNRDYDDALLEMQDLALAAGFVPFAAAALVAEHSLMPGVAAGRPDARDKQQIVEFAKASWQQLQQACGPEALCIPAVKGNRPYRDYPAIPFKPTALRACVKCGACAAHCPQGAISAADPTRTDASRCICCMRCVAVCPHQARGINKLLLAVAGKAFSLKYGKRKEPEFFS